MDILMIFIIFLLLVATALIIVSIVYATKTETDPGIESDNKKIYIACGITGGILLVVDLYLYYKVYPNYKMAAYTRIIKLSDEGIHVANREMKKACEYINKHFNDMSPADQVAFKSANPLFESEQRKCLPEGGHTHWQKGYGI